MQRKAFYLYEEDVALIEETQIRLKKQENRRITESEVIRRALRNDL